MTTRVTVVLNRLNPEDDVVFLEEWVHEDGFAAEERGVRLSWGARDGETFIPWTSVLRVDREPCDCMHCAEPEPTLDDVGEPEPTLA